MFKSYIIPNIKVKEISSGKLYNLFAVYFVDKVCEVYEFDPEDTVFIALENAYIFL